MSRAFTDWNVDQAVLFPATARDYVPEDHPAMTTALGDLFVQILRICRAAGLAKIREAKAQRNFTDPDSRIMRDKGT